MNLLQSLINLFSSKQVQTGTKKAALRKFIQVTDKGEQTDLKNFLDIPLDLILQ